MKPSDAAEIVRILISAFPGLSLEPDAAKVWAGVISELADAQAATEVALGMARNLRQPPTLALFREQYFSLTRRKLEAQQPRQIGPVGSGPRELPASVREWMAGHGLRSVDDTV